jgi:sirohydrochlorin ferrochelatase
MTTTNKGPIGVMICGHGSRDDDAVREFGQLAEHLTARFPDWPVESGFLEFARPVIRESMGKLLERGARHILAVPAMLFAAGHVKNDLPWEVNTFAAEHPGCTVEFGAELGLDPKLLKAGRARIEEAEAAHPSDIPRSETLLMVVGRGTNDSDANSNVSKVARMLWEGMGFGWAEVCYSGVAFPRVDQGLDPSGHRVREGALSQRPPLRHRQLRGAGPVHPGRRYGHELSALQVPGAGDRLRGQRGGGPGRTPPPCQRHWNRWWPSPSSWSRAPP